MRRREFVSHAATSLGSLLPAVSGRVVEAVRLRDPIPAVAAVGGAPAAGTMDARAASANPAFPWGVASFEPLQRQVLIWTRVAAPGRRLDLVGGVLPAGPAGGSEPDFQADAEPPSEVAFEVEAGADRTGAVLVDLQGLEPGTRYWYRFLDGDLASPLGLTRTLPEAGVERVRLGAVSCARFANGSFAAYRALAQRDVDLVVHLGDYIYEDGDGGARAHTPPHDLVSETDYHERYAQHRSDLDLAELHRRHPMVTLWDDHDLAGNAWSTGARDHDPAVHGPWAARVESALAARRSWLPVRLADPRQPASAWRRARFGTLATLALTETRLAGRDAPVGTPGAPDLHDAGRSKLGELQREWVEEVAAAPGWLLLASATVVSPLTVPSAALALLGRATPQGFATSGAVAFNPDQWDGYPAERDRLARALTARSGPTVVVSGDLHSSWALESWTGDDREVVAVECVVPAVSSSPMGRALGGGTEGRGSDLASGPGQATAAQLALGALVPGVGWVDISHNGFVILDVVRERIQAEWWAVATNLDPTDGGAAAVPEASLLAAWTVSAERAAWERARSATADPRTPAAGPTDGSTPDPDGRAEQAHGTGRDDDGRPRPGGGGSSGVGLEPTVLGGAAAAGLAGLAALVALRRRRGTPG